MHIDTRPLILYTDDIWHKSFQNKNQGQIS